METAKQLENLKVIRQKAHAALREAGAARRQEDGIPADWTWRKVRSYRQFLRRHEGEAVTPQQWENGEGKKEPGSKSGKPEGWTEEEWRAYRSSKNAWKGAGRGLLTPERWREEVSRYPPEVYERRAQWNASRGERQKAAVEKILKVAEQESRRRVA